MIPNLYALKAHLAAMTKGPLLAVPSKVSEGEVIVYTADANRASPHHHDGIGVMLGRLWLDGEHVVALVNACPDLIAEVERLREELAEANEMCATAYGSTASDVLAENERLRSEAEASKRKTCDLHAGQSVGKTRDVCPVCFSEARRENARLTTEMNRALAEAEMAGHDADMAEERGFRAGWQGGLGNEDSWLRMSEDEAWADYQKEKGERCDTK